MRLRSIAERLNLPLRSSRRNFRVSSSSFVIADQEAKPARTKSAAAIRNCFPRKCAKRWRFPKDLAICLERRSAFRFSAAAESEVSGELEVSEDATLGFLFRLARFLRLTLLGRDRFHPLE